MEPQHMQAAIEAMLFASETPLSLTQIVQALLRLHGEQESAEQQESLQQHIEQAFLQVVANWQPHQEHRGLELRPVAGGYAFRSNKIYSAAVLALKEQKPVRLSRAALETLAIVAYKQPITKPEMDEIRGVDCTTTVKILLERQLITMAGRKEDVGRPALYATTEQFLQFLHLSSLDALPPLREVMALEQPTTLEQVPFDAMMQQSLDHLASEPSDAVQELDQAMRQLEETEHHAQQQLQQDGVALQDLPQADGCPNGPSSTSDEARPEHLAS